MLLIDQIFLKKLNHWSIPRSFSLSGFTCTVMSFLLIGEGEEEGFIIFFATDSAVLRKGVIIVFLYD